MATALLLSVTRTLAQPSAHSQTPQDAAQSAATEANERADIMQATLGGRMAELGTALEALAASSAAALETARTDADAALQVTSVWRVMDEVAR
jgi:hypothetical protein